MRLAKAGSLYRVHGQPEEKRVTELLKVMSALKVGATFSEQPSPREFRQLVERLAARPDGVLLEGLVIRALAQAVYQQTNIGHFGLALEEYAHFTSPIRRYPDLLVHRAIKAAVVPNSASGHKLLAPPSCRRSAPRARSASGAPTRRRATSWDTSNACTCSRESGRVFEATISSALEFGLFVQLKEMPIDGLVHISAIPGDYWELENGGMGLVGQRTGRRWQMGDTVRVRLSRVDLTQRQIDFELLDADARRLARHGARAAARRVRSTGRGAGREARRGATAPPAAAAAGAADAADAAGVAERSAIWSMVCMPSARSSSARRSGCSSCGSPSRATMRAPAA